MTAYDAVLNNIKPLAARLINNFLTGDYEQRRESAIALSKFKGEKSTDFLLETYESDNIQDFMALALGNIDSSKAVDLLIKALNDSQQEVRFNAAQALGMLENPEALDILVEALNSYVESSVSSPEEPVDEHNTQIFFEEDAIICAILAVGKIKNWQSISLLKRLLAQEKSARIRASIIMALGMMSSDKLMPVFQSALRDEDPRVRANAIEAIESIKSGSIVGIIQPYLDDPSNRVRANVAKAIWKYGDFDVSDTLKQMLGHSDKWYRASSAYAIGEIKDARFIKELAKALKDEDPDVRRNATNALRKLEAKDALPHLKPMLDDPNFDVRVEAVLAVSRCAPEDAATLLRNKLEVEENFIVQATLISCLGASQKPELITVIKKYLNSEDPRVVSNTIDAMVKLTKEPDSGIISTLKELISHDDNRVKSTAIRTLWVWGEYEVLESLQSLFASDDRKSIRSATFVLGEIGREISACENLSQQMNELLTELIDNPDSIAEQISLPVNFNKTPSPEKAIATDNTEISKVPDHKDPHSETSHDQPLPEAQPPEDCIQTDLMASTAQLEIDNDDPDETVKPSAAEVITQILPENSFTQEIDTANAYIAARKFSEAESIFKQIMRENPRHLKAISAYANMCLLQKRSNDAIKLYKESLKLNPNIVKAHYNLGTLLFQARKYEEAARYLVKALKLYPKILGAYLILAQIYQIAGKLDESIKLLSRAASLSPRNPVIYQKLATLHIHQRQFEQAIEILLKAVSISPLDVESNLLLAYCFNLTEQPQKAFSAMDLTLRACAQSPHQDQSLKQLLKGYLYLNSILNEATPIKD